MTDKKKAQAFIDSTLEEAKTKLRLACKVACESDIKLTFAYVNKNWAEAPLKENDRELLDVLFIVDLIGNE